MLSPSRKDNELLNAKRLSKAALAAFACAFAWAGCTLKTDAPLPAQQPRTIELSFAQIQEIQPEETPEVSSAFSALTEAETESMSGLESSLAQTDESQRDPAPETVENLPVVPELKPDYGTSVLTADTQIKGDIQCLADLEVHGQIYGSLFCEGRVFVDGEVNGGIQAQNVTLNHAKIQGDILCAGELEVLEQSVITGNLQAEKITLNGRIKGNLYCKNLLVLMACSFVEGDIITGKISVQEGAQMTGSLTTSESENG